MTLSLFETVVPVSDLDRASAFYCDVLGCRVAVSGTPGHRRFLWLPERNGVLVLRASVNGTLNPVHFALETDRPTAERIAQHLRESGLSEIETRHHD